MSWFKKGRADSKSTGHSGNNDDLTDGRSPTDTDPQTCLEVFQNHWKQALQVIGGDRNGNTQKGQKCSNDELEAVLQNFEQMITLLAGEEGLDENGQGMPGPILHYLLEEKIFERFCDWCLSHAEHGEKLKQEQLRMFEQLISQSHQLLLIHKAIIQPLLKLLSLCANTVKLDTENKLVLVLHQLCVCISQETLILESFFNTSANHGPARFLIFSLLIPYIHREGKVGQLARDALLLIMTLSSKYPHIGVYIAENSDFCPVLATGLSGLYSSLPRKIPCYTDEWHQFTQDDVNHIPELQMFLNSLEFCNAVTQIGHPAIRSQLMKYIYDGFLVPVLGPALHQNSREEVIAATAYLELFLRRATEPELIKTFLKFILTEQNDEIVILDSLVTRINSSSKPLCVVSLSLFKTLVDLNCEDVMFQLLFKYLVPCTHVMVSQRRNVNDLDLYGKSAERFLSLRPSCCVPADNDSRTQSASSERYLSNSSDANIPSTHAPRPRHGLGSFLRARKREQNYQKKRAATVSSTEQQKPGFPTTSIASQLKNYETDYSDYLVEARLQLENCAKACGIWTYPYDGNCPSAGVFSELEENSTLNCDTAPSSEDKFRLSASLSDSGTESNNSKATSVQFLYHGDTLASSIPSEKSDSALPPTTQLDDDVFQSDISSSYQSKGSDLSEILRNYDKSSREDCRSSTSESKDESEFLSYIDGIETPPDQEGSLEESIESLEAILSNYISLSSLTSSSTKSESCDSSVANSNPKTSEETSLKSNKCVDEVTEETDCMKNSLSSCSNPSSVDSKKAKCDGTTFEVIEDVDSNAQAMKLVMDTPSPKDSTSFIDISMSHFKKDINDSSLPEASQTSESVHSIRRNSSKDEGFSKSVSFNLTPVSSMQSTSSISQNSSAAIVRVPSESASKISPNQPNIGAFLMALFSKLDGMMQNSLPVNLLLTGIISRLAAYPQPLLRSFLLSHNLVFQPSVKSLLQVLTSVRQKVDHFALTLPSFNGLLLKARQTLVKREENWVSGVIPRSPYLQNTVSPVKAPPVIENNTKDSLQWFSNKATTHDTTCIDATLNDATRNDTSQRKVQREDLAPCYLKFLGRTLTKEKKKLSLADLFKRSPTKRTLPTIGKGGPQLQVVQGGRGYRYINYQNKPQEVVQNPMDLPKIRNAVYCAIVLEEFLKELAALSQEHAVLYIDNGCSSYEEVTSV